MFQCQSAPYAAAIVSQARATELDVAMIRSLAHCGTTAFALSFEKSGGTSNLPVCRSYLQRQSFTTPVCWGLRLLMSASPDG